MYVFVAFSVGQTQSLFFFKVCNLKPVFEKAEFDVAGKVLFRRI